MMRFARLYPRRFSRRRLIIWGGIILAVLTITSYVLWSRQEWTQYESRYTTWHQQIKTDIEKTVELSVASSEDRVRALAAFVDITKHIDTTHPTACKLHSLLQWQASLEPLKKKQAVCQAVVQQSIDFNERLKKVTLYLQDDRALATLIATIPQSDELNSADWTIQTTAWVKTTDSIKTMKVSEDFKPVQSQAIKQAGQVATAWQEVVAADQAKDKKRFLSAQDSLAAAHDGLNEITIVSDKQMLELTRLLQEEYAKAFADKI